MYTFSPTKGERFYNMPDREVWFASGRIELTDEQAPSVTTKLGVWPKGREFHEWMASKENLREAERERDEGGKRGTRVHQYIEKVIRGEAISFHEYKNEFFRGDDFLAYDEWRRIESFAQWHEDMGYPVIVTRRSGKPALECTLYSWDDWFAGTTDIVVTGGKFGNARVMVDFKTGKSIYDSFWAQLAAYRKAWKEMGEEEIDAVGVLLFGGLGRKQYSFELCADGDELDRWHLDFLAASRIWDRCNQETKLSKGERMWGEVKSRRTVFEVRDVIKLPVPALDPRHMTEQEEMPAWAQRPDINPLPMKPLPPVAKDLSVIGKEVPNPPDTSARKRPKIVIP